MSYLNFPRLTFSGQFQADVSTVNNDTRHFDNDTFNSDFQKFSDKSQGSLKHQVQQRVNIDPLS